MSIFQDFLNDCIGKSLRKKVREMNGIVVNPSKKKRIRNKQLKKALLIKESWDKFLLKNKAPENMVQIVEIKNNEGL